MKNYKPISFSTQMVQAIMEGRKTQTRRVIKSDAKRIGRCPIVLNGYGGFIDEHGSPVKPKYQIGDILWVRETFCECKTPDIPHDRNWKFCYKADGDFGSGITWKPSIQMPKEAARIFLEVTNLRTKRLQDISEEDAIAEGIMPLTQSRMQLAMQGQLYFNYSKKPCFFNEGLRPIKSFKSLWQKINGKKYPWKSNPWVWVYEFKQVEKPNDFN